MIRCLNIFRENLDTAAKCLDMYVLFASSAPGAQVPFFSKFLGFAMSASSMTVVMGSFWGQVV